jgi:hypothetical protein
MTLSLAVAEQASWGRREGDRLLRGEEGKESIA